MKVHQIATATGMESKEVATHFGLEGKAVHLREVDDGDATAYIKERDGSMVEDAPVVRFWSTREQHYIPTDKPDEREDIKFFEWIYEGKLGSPEVDLLQSNPAQMQALHIYEIVESRFDNVGKAGEFMLALRKCIYTGVSEQDGASREGRNCVRALLGAERLKGLDNVSMHVAQSLIKEVANSVSLKVDVMPTEL